jgi:CoA:oxalate CoA-transferase
MLDVSMLDCQIAVLENAFARYSATGEPPKAIGTRHPSSTPFQAFPTQDGYIVIALGFGLENVWGMFCSLIGHAELLYDPRFETPGLRTKNHADLEPILIDGLKTRTTAEWLAEFEAIDIPCGPLHTIPEAARYPQVQARDMLRDVESGRGNRLRISNSPLKLSRTPAGIRGGPPRVGTDTRDVLANLLDLTEAEIDAEFAGGAAVEGQDLPDYLTQA